MRYNPIAPILLIPLLNGIFSGLQVDDTVNDLKGQLREAELNFVRKLGTLKYLKHLEKNKQLENCPICDQQPKQKV